LLPDSFFPLPDLVTVLTIREKKKVHMYHQPINLKTTILLLRNSIGRSTARHGLVLMALPFFGFSLSPASLAVTPAPDGGYANNNTAEGTNALKSLTTGFANTAIGFEALFNNTTAFNNTATGDSALAFNTTGDANTANGAAALISNTSGGGNTATGWQALFSNTTGNDNTANGVGVLYSNTTGGGNTATGSNALLFNTTGNNNTATGAYALFGCNGDCPGAAVNNNTATGASALFSNSTGNNNTATGVNALEYNDAGNNNTAEGFQALANNFGSNNIALGANAGINLTSGNNNIDIGARGVAGESDTIRIGRGGVQKTAYIQGISGTTVASGVTVIVAANGHLGTVQSSARVKEAIKPMDKASEAILALKPVTFRYKKELDPEGIPQFGLVAEEVEKISPDLVARDENGQVYTVRYEAVNAMLLNEFLKQHRKVQEQEVRLTKQEATISQQQKDFQSTIAQQQEEIKALTASVKEQAAQVQKVSTQLELSKPALQMIANRQ
jgi:hypothetical protein